MDPKDPSMLASETTGSMNIMTLYQLAHDEYNEIVDLSISDITELKDQYGWDHEIEATIRIYKRPDSPSEGEPITVVDPILSTVVETTEQTQQ